MKLRWQLFLAISLVVFAAFLGLIVTEVRGTQAYLEEQLGSHAQDAASSLAHPLAQSLARGDAQLATTQVTSLFDRGYFQRIVVLDAQGKVLLERSLPPKIEDVPAWFSGLFPLVATPGEAFVSSGWRQLGKVVVVSQPAFAYQHLWRSLVDTAIWMLLFYVLALVLMDALLRMILKPVAQIEQSAIEIQQKRFRQITLRSWAPELRRVVKAMNDMSRKIAEILDAESARAEQFRKEAYVDELTGFDNRRSFDLRFNQLLKGKVAFSDGALIGIEVNHLKEFNTEASYKEGDAYLKQLADTATEVFQGRAAILCRTAGGSFCFVILGMAHDALADLAQALQKALAVALHGLDRQGGVSFSIGVVNFHFGEQRSQIMARLDLAIESARQGQHNGVRYVADMTPGAGDLGSLAWRDLIRNALSENRWRLLAQPVVSLKEGALVQQEVMTRLVDGEGQLLPASTFMPMALRHRLMADIDRALLSMVFTMQEMRVATGHAIALAINMSMQSLSDAQLMSWLSTQLQRLQKLSAPLCFELSEYGCATDLDRAREFAALVRHHKARFGIDHFGLTPASLQLLRDLPPDYIKLDAGLVADAPHSEQSRALLRSIVALASSLDVDVIAQGVETPDQVALLVQDAVTAGQGYHFGRPSPEGLQ